jgi:predicted nucleic acid-binding protein
VKLIASYTNVLLDTSPIINFAAAGHHLALVDYVWNNGFITTFVRDELLRKAADHPRVSEFLEAWPEDGILDASPDEAIEIDKMLRVRSVHAHPLEDAGEISSVVIAASFDEPHSSVVIDDNWGRRLAEQWNVPCGITPELVIEMVWARKLTEEEGAEVWNVALSKPEAQAAYTARLAELLPRLGERPEPT